MRTNSSQSLRLRYCRKPRLEALEQRLALAAATGLTSANSLVFFDTDAPATVSAPVAVTGLVAGDTLVGIDYRPATGALYGLGVNAATAHLYRITIAGVATQVGGNIALPQSATVTGAETDFGFDFNPTVDRIRVVANNRDNFRLHPDTGAVAGTDTALNPGTPAVVGAAYTNNFAGSTVTTLYVIDSGTDQLLVQGGNPVPPGASPNLGTLTVVGALGVNATNEVGLDIASVGGADLVVASLQVGTASGLYTINLTSGAATLVGNFGGAATIRDLAVFTGTFDFGDAPDTYGTLLADDGARHVRTGPFLGIAPDLEPDGQPTSDATGDDFTGAADEDGVLLPVTLGAGLSAAATVTASADGVLDAWIDFDSSGTFDAGEQIAASIAVLAGDNTLSFTVPSSAVSAITFARFRISTAGGLDATGAALDGEVEDYAIEIVAPTPATATLVGDTLVVAGTTRNDVIIIEPRPSNRSQIRVRINGRQAGNFSAAAVQQIVVLGLAGNDTIIVNPTLAKPAELHGNEGNDVLFGGRSDDLLFGEAGRDTLFGRNGNDGLDGGDGNDFLYGEAGNDVLLGSAGNDFLFGAAGRDILIGGLGRDHLNGGAGDDILIGGTTDNDADIAALTAIMQEWSTSASAAARIGNLTLGGGLNGSFVFDPGVTVQADGAVDTLISGIGFDWYLRSTADGDRLLDVNASKDRVDSF